MTKRTHLIRSTGSAIAAALALASTPVLAQEIVLPPATTTSPQTPTPPPPQTQTPPAPTPQPEMVSSPVVQDTPPTVVVPDVPEAAPEEAAPEPRAEAPAAEPVQAREAAPAPSEARVADASPVAAPDAPLGEATSEDLVPVVAPVADAVPVAGDTAVQPETADTANQGALGLLAALLAAIAVVALAVWGFVAIGRRKQARVAVPVVERPVIADRAPEPQPTLAPPLATREASVTPLASPRPAATADSVAHSGASVALPSRMPESFEERDALLKRMIAAKPDRANPFTSPLQRRRRAKLILQSLGRDFGDIEPWIDLSQYPSNWPSVARRTSAAA